MIKAGKVCKVIEDSDEFFKSGDIVVALENSAVPYCCLEKHYNPRYSLNNYNVNQVSPLKQTELEELYDWAEK